MAVTGKAWYCNWTPACCIIITLHKTYIMQSDHLPHIPRQVWELMGAKFYYCQSQAISPVTKHAKPIHLLPYRYIFLSKKCGKEYICAPNEIGSVSFMKVICLT